MQSLVESVEKKKGSKLEHLKGIIAFLSDCIEIGEDDLDGINLDFGEQEKSVIPFMNGSRAKSTEVNQSHSTHLGMLHSASIKGLQFYI